MGAMLEALHRLQVVENQLRSVREQIESKRRVLQNLQRREATLKRQLTDQHTLIQQAQSNVDRLELDRKSHEDHIAKLRETLNKTKTNKEYTAILSQINTDTADNRKLEDAELAGMQRVEELRKQEAEFKATLQKEQTRLTAARDEVAAVEARLAGRLKELEERRAATAAEVEPEALVIFERAGERHEGEAMAIISKIHPKRAEYICSGCNMALTLETVNALQSRDAVLPCNTCGRILYLEAPAGASA